MEDKNIKFLYIKKVIRFIYIFALNAAVGVKSSYTPSPGDEGAFTHR